MNRQRVLAAAVICVLVGAGFYIYIGHDPTRDVAKKAAVDPGEGPAVPVTTPDSAGSQSASTTAPATPAPAVQPHSSSSNTPTTPDTVYAAPPPASPQPADGVTDVDPHKAFGSKNAPVIMEVFSDFQCPACKTLYNTTNRQLMDNYVSTGKVYLIHRDFPLTMHAYSRIAARYARAAAQLGKVEAVEQALFQSQEKWEQSGDVDSIVAGVLSAADMTKVRALVKGGTLEPLIDKDFALGQMYRVNQTPTTVFHRKGQTYPYSGVMSYDILKQFLEQLLSQK